MAAVRIVDDLITQKGRNLAHNRSYLPFAWKMSRFSSARWRPFAAIASERDAVTG